MSLTSVITNLQNGSLDLLATQYTNPPGLANTSGEAIKIAITATGQWYLVKPDFATNDPGLVKYKTPVDGDGYARDQNDQKFNFKYPQLNPGALVAEIKDLQGNTKSTVSSKQQSFELQPGDTASFIINDDPKWYGNNAGKLTIGYSTNPITLNSLKPTPLVAIADLYNTGVDNDRKVLGDSISDPHYTLATYPAGTVTPGVTTPNKDLAPINWVANTQTARWIGPNTTSATGPVGDYSYKTTFTLPSFAEAVIIGELSVDDWITDILINGVSLGNPVPLSSWTNIRKFSISKGFVVGTNTIEFKLHSVGGPTGLRIDSISGTYRPSVLKATVYEHPNFQGISKELLPGSYGIGGFGLANDTLSSLKVDKGLKVTLYEHGDATGRSKTFTSDAAWVGHDFNDITSNIKVELLTAPIVVTVPPANAPTIPQGFHSPFTFTPSAAPVIQWNGYTYWAYSYVDNRMSMAIVAYDAKGQIVKQWEKPGARYLASITVDSTKETVTLIGQANQTTVLSWSELQL